jgi:hypothetical protein
MGFEPMTFRLSAGRYNQAKPPALYNIAVLPILI